MKLKIIGPTREGEWLNFCGTRVVNAATGEDIDGVRSVSWKHEVNSLPVAVIEVSDVEIDGPK